MADFDAIVIGSSAGGVMALKQLVAGLPADFGTPIFIVQHVAAGRDTYLPRILSQAGPLPVVYPEDGMEIQKGTIYLAPPDYHMLLEKGRILVKRGPKENRFRPAIDALFRSAAYVYGPGAIGVILTGMLDDGCSGMWSLKRMGGVTIVQDPEQALYPSMPLNVLQYIEADHVCHITEIGSLLVELTRTAEPNKPVAEEKEISLLKMEVDIAALQNAFDSGVTEKGEHTTLTCPECGGAFNAIAEGKAVRYRCHTGHAYSSAILLEDVAQTTEHKLWAALRSMEEAIMIVEKEAAVTQNVSGKPSVSHLVRAEALKKQTGEMHNFLNNYLQSEKLRCE